jgi:pimeloyl-ACP methyl ester carboxylesterase
MRVVVYGCLSLILISICTATLSAQRERYQSQTANLSGARIHYLKAGTGKKTLVLIHGFGDTSHMWIPLLEPLGNDYTIIAPDMRGLGESSRPSAGYDKKTIAADIHELVKSLGFQKIDLVGHDIGLMVAYAYAAQYPAEVEKLALLEAPIPGIGDIWQMIYTTPALWHFHFVKSPIALELVKGRERLSWNISGKLFRHIPKPFPKQTAGFMRKPTHKWAPCGRRLKCSSCLTLRTRRTTVSLRQQNCRCRF